MRSWLFAAVLLSGSAWAGDPVRCEAIWLRAVKACPVASTWAATGVGRDEASARAHAIERLQAVLRSAATVQSIKAPSRYAAPSACALAVNDHGRVSCLPNADLAEKRRCFVDFEEEGCHPIPMFEEVGVAWKVMEKARDKMCDQVDVVLRRADPFTRHRCRAACLQDTRVRCPVEEAADPKTESMN